jgi:hypothetical protein
MRAQLAPDVPTARLAPSGAGEHAFGGGRRAEGARVGASPDLLASYTPPQVSSTTTGTDPELATLATSYTYNADRLVTAIQVPESNAFQTVTKGYDTFGRLGSTAWA